jgi:transaldolase
MNPTTELHKLGQNLWLDNITRDLLARHVAASRARLPGEQIHLEFDDLDHAVRNTNVYDHAIRDATARGRSGRSIPLTYRGFRNAPIRSRQRFRTICGSR